MSAATLYRGNRPAVMRPVRPDPSVHLYEVGQAVRLKDGFARATPASEIYQITARLPPRGGSPQYRIRSEGERHERVATQDSLDAVVTAESDDSSTLIERTFGHGQGTDAKQQGSAQAEEGEGPAEA